MSVGVATPALAQSDEPDLFGRTGIYDLTGDPAIQDVRIDQDYVTGRKQTYGELKGLAGAPVVEVRRNYMYIQDADGSLTIPPRSGRDFGEWFNFAGREVYRVFPDEFVFFVLYTTFDARIGAFFYSPEANDIRGIAGNGIFDSNGSSPREGIVFMNYYLAIDEIYGQLGVSAVRAQRRSVFNQEIGHRWGAFTPLGAGVNGSGADILLGRDDGHWSFFMDSGGSPMEGNSWVDNGDGTFTTTTNFNNFMYNDLDLYLMGLIDPAEAQPWFVIDNPVVGSQRDMFNQPLNRASPPHIISQFRGNQITVSGTRVDQSVDMIARRHGTRSPSHLEAPRSFRTIIILLGGQNSPASDSVLDSFESLVDEYATGWAEGTGGRAELDYVLMEQVDLTPIGGACTEAAECDPADATLCVAYPADAQSLCTRPCETEATCPTSWCCKSLGVGSANVCMTGPVCDEPDPDPDPDPNACTCDVTADACDMGCNCDTACGFVNGICSCDLTTSCDVGSTGGDCLCDPECPGEETSGCDCTSTETGAAGTSFALLVLIAGLLGVRRRR